MGIYIHQSVESANRVIFLKRDKFRKYENFMILLNIEMICTLTTGESSKHSQTIVLVSTHPMDLV